MQCHQPTCWPIEATMSGWETLVETLTPTSTSSWKRVMRLSGDSRESILTFSFLFFVLPLSTGTHAHLIDESQTAWYRAVQELCTKICSSHHIVNLDFFFLPVCAAVCDVDILREKKCCYLVLSAWKRSFSLVYSLASFRPAGEARFLFWFAFSPIRLDFSLLFSFKRKKGMSQLVYRIFPSGLTTFPLYSRLSTFFFLNSHFFNCRTIQKNKTQDSRTNSSSFDSIESLTTPSSQTSWLNRLCVTDWSYTVDRKVLSSSSRLTRDGRARVSVDGRHNKLMSQQQWFMEASIGRLNYRMDDKKRQQTLWRFRLHADTTQSLHSHLVWQFNGHRQIFCLDVTTVEQPNKIQLRSMLMVAVRTWWECPRLLFLVYTIIVFP